MSSQLIAIADCQSIDKSGRVVSKYTKGQDIGLLVKNNNDGTYLVNKGEYVVADKVAIKLSPGLNLSSKKVVSASRDNSTTAKKTRSIRIIQLYPWLPLVMILIAAHQLSKDRKGLALTLGIAGTILLIKKK